MSSLHTSPQSVSTPSGPLPGYRWLILVLSWAAFLMTSLDRSVWGPAAPSVGGDLGVALSSLGVFATCYYVGYVVSNFLGGVASDWFGPRAVLGGSILVAGAGMVTFGNVHSMALGFVIQALVGLFAGADYAAGAKSISVWFSGRERALAVSLFTTATSLGTVIANLVVPTLIKSHGWRVSYELFGSISIVLGIVILILHRNAPGATGAEAAGASAAVPSTAVGAETGPGAQPKHPFPNLLDVLRNRNLLILAVAGFFSLWGTYGFITWANTLMIKGVGIDPVHAGVVVSLFAITAVVCKPIIGFIDGRTKFHSKYLAAGILLMFSIMLLIFGRLHDLTLFYIAAPFLGFAAYCYSPIQNNLILGYAGRGLSGSSAGSINAIWQLGSVIVPTAVGAVFSATDSVYASFTTLAAGPLLAALLMLPLGAVKR